ncbi:ATP-binding cassette domain-containing protein [Verrucomicrobiota bacterium]
MKVYECNNLKKYYGDILVLDIASLSFDKGGFYIIYGPNAAGKTTLLNLLAFLDRPDAGTIAFRGTPGSKKIHRSITDVTLIMQTPYLFKGTVLQNVCRGLAFRGMKKDRMLKRAQPVMEKLGLWKLYRRDVSALSGGERRKVAVARSLVLDTDIILLDEPTAHLDSIHVTVIEQIISEAARKAGKTVIMTTHDIHQAHRLVDDIICLTGGRITQTPLWNNFKVVIRAANGVKKAKLAGGPDVYVVTEREGDGSIAIHPKDIILSREPIHSSALNCLKGRITGVNEVNSLVDVVVDTGAIFHSFITHASFRKMNLVIGQEIFLTFKASAVEVF